MYHLACAFCFPLCSSVLHHFFFFSPRPPDRLDKNSRFSPRAVLILSIKSNGLGQSAQEVGSARAGAQNLKNKGIPGISTQRDPLSHGQLHAPRPTSNHHRTRAGSVLSASRRPTSLTWLRTGCSPDRRRAHTGAGHRPARAQWMAITAHPHARLRAGEKKKKKIKNSYSSPPAGPSWIWAEPGDPFQAYKVCEGPLAGSGPGDSGEMSLELRSAHPRTGPWGLCLTLGAKLRVKQPPPEFQKLPAGHGMFYASERKAGIQVTGTGSRGRARPAGRGVGGRAGGSSLKPSRPPVRGCGLFPRQPLTTCSSCLFQGKHSPFAPWHSPKLGH